MILQQSRPQRGHSRHAGDGAQGGLGGRGAAVALVRRAAGDRDAVGGRQQGVGGGRAAAGGVVQAGRGGEAAEGFDGRESWRKGHLQLQTLCCAHTVTVRRVTRVLLRTYSLWWYCRGWR